MTTLIDIAPTTGFNLVQARLDTSCWPPFDGDIWADRDGRDWLATITILPNDDAIIGFSHGNTRCLPSYALEMYGPLTLTSKGHERARFEQLPAEARARHAAYLASRCVFCGPEGATGVECDDCDAEAVAA